MSIALTALAYVVFTSAIFSELVLLLQLRERFREPAAGQSPAKPLTIFIRSKRPFR